MQLLLAIGLARMMQWVNFNQVFAGLSRFCGIFHVHALFLSSSCAIVVSNKNGISQFIFLFFTGSFPTLLFVFILLFFFYVSHIFQRFAHVQQTEISNKMERENDNFDVKIQESSCSAKVCNGNELRSQFTNCCGGYSTFIKTTWWQII